MKGAQFVHWTVRQDELRDQAKLSAVLFIKQTLRRSDISNILGQRGPEKKSTMADVKIECPHCHQSFKLNETLAAPLIEQTRQKFAREFEEKEEELQTRRKTFADEQKAADRARKILQQERESLAKEKEQIDEQVAEKVKEQRAPIEREAMKKATQKFDEKLAERDQQKAELEEAIKEKDVKLAEARKAEVDFRKKQRELDDKLKAADVAVEKRVTEALAPEREKAKKDAEEQQRLKMAEKDKVIEDQKRQLAEAQRKLEQGSQQLQGEVLELQLESILTAKFPFDQFEPVPKGEHGGDIIHHVHGPNGQPCGTILWEFKRAKNWSDGWLGKLREDQRVCKAEVCVIVSIVLPKGIDTFDHLDGVWVTAQRCVLPVAYVLRQSLIELAGARQAGEGQQTKMELVYQYMTGPRFRQRVQGIVEAFSDMREDLDRERRAITKQWAKREEQIERVMQSTVGMYGDLQGIAGKTLQEIEGISLVALPSAGHEL